MKKIEKKEYDVTVYVKLTCVFVTMTTGLVIGRCIVGATGHALIVETIEMQWSSTCFTGILTRTGARTTGFVASFTGLSGRVIIL